MRNAILFLVLLVVFSLVWFDSHYQWLGKDSLIRCGLGRLWAEKGSLSLLKQVEKIKISWKGKSLSLEKRDSHWCISEGKDCRPANEEMVTGFLMDVLGARFSRILPLREEYKIGQGDWVELTFSDGKVLRVEFGEDLPYNRARYARVGDTVGILDYIYLFRLDRLDEWPKREEKDAGGEAKGGPVSGEGATAPPQSGPAGGGGDKETGPVGGEEVSRAGQG